MRARGPQTVPSAIKRRSTGPLAFFHYADSVTEILKRRIGPWQYVVLLTGVWLFFLPLSVQAKSVRGSISPTIRIFSAEGSPLQSVQAYAATFKGGVSVASADLDGDGAWEIITGAGSGGGPEVRVFGQDGTLRQRFFAYGRGFRGGVRVAAYDLTGDGRAEIITGPGYGGGPEVKIYQANGQLLKSFFAYDQKFHGGVNVTAGRFGARGEALIITGSGYGGAHVRSFTPEGKFAGINLRPFGQEIHGVSVAVLPNGSRDKLLVSPERSAVVGVKVFNLDSPTKPERSFRVFPDSFRGGAHLAAGDVNGDGQVEIVVGAGSGGGPEIRILNTTGRLERRFMALDESFRGGANVAVAPNKILVGPGSVTTEGRADLFKYIEVDLSDQTLKYYQNGQLLGSHRVSTGKWMTPTPIGTFKTYNKIPLAYSKPYDLYMEWWMAFTPDGSYGVHALPFWKNPNGGRRYEGERSIGNPASHGCIRQTLKEAKQLYDWADIGTPVIVKR